MRRVTLHIGLHKTASTYIQQSLVRNRSTLADHGILYPATGSKAPGHAQSRLLVESPDTGAGREALAHFREWTNSADGHQVLISSEWLSMVADREIERIRETLDDCDVRIVCFFRNQIERLQSFFSEDAKKFLESDFPEWVEDHIREPHYRYDEVLRRWSRVFGADAVRPVIYEEVEDPALTLLEAAGCGAIDANKWKSPGNRLNERKSARTLALNRKLCRLVGNRLSSQRYRSGIGNEVRRYAVNQGWNKESLNLYSQAMLEQVNEYFTRPNQRFEKLIGRSLPPVYFGQFETPPIGGPEDTAQTEQDLAEFLAELAESCKSLTVRERLLSVLRTLTGRL